MTSVMHRCILLVLALTGIICSLSVQASYTFKIIDYPGAAATQLLGLNNSGQVVGQAFSDAAADVPPVNFLYDLTTEVFTNLLSYPGEETFLDGINDAGETVGSAYPLAGPPPEITGLILSAERKFTTFSHPAPSANTYARGVNNPGLVTGYAQDDSMGNTVALIYDPIHSVYTDLPFVYILPTSSPRVIAQGINTAGEVVGNVRLPDQGKYSGYAGRYGFLLDTYGTINLFQVNGFDTRARGINDSGLITGYFVDEQTPTGSSGSLPASFQTLNVPGTIDTFPEAINNSGAIVGDAD